MSIRPFEYRDFDSKDQEKLDRIATVLIPLALNVNRTKEEEKLFSTLIEAFRYTIDGLVRHYFWTGKRWSK